MTIKNPQVGGRYRINEIFAEDGGVARHVGQEVIVTLVRDRLGPNSYVRAKFADPSHRSVHDEQAFALTELDELEPTPEVHRYLISYHAIRADRTIQTGTVTNVKLDTPLTPDYIEKLIVDFERTFGIPFGNLHITFIYKYEETS